MRRLLLLVLLLPLLALVALAGCGGSPEAGEATLWVTNDRGAELIVNAVTTDPSPLFALVAPVVGIDHIFVSAHFTAQEIHIIPESYGSDHRPVVATLGFVR